MILYTALISFFTLSDCLNRNTKLTYSAFSQFPCTTALPAKYFESKSVFRDAYF